MCVCYWSEGEGEGGEWACVWCLASESRKNGNVCVFVIRCTVPWRGKSKAAYYYISIVRGHLQMYKTSLSLPFSPARPSCRSFLFTVLSPLTHIISPTLFHKHPLYSFLCSHMSVIHTNDSLRQCVTSPRWPFPMYAHLTHMPKGVVKGLADSVLFRCRYEWRSSVSEYLGLNE